MTEKEAIKRIKESRDYKYTHFGFVDEDGKAFDMAIAALENQINNRWTPCSERLPEDEEIEYILCISGKRGHVTYERAVVTDGGFEEGEWYLGGIKLDSNITVHAWMPIPEPYKEEL